MLAQMNYELTNQLDAFTNREVTQKYVQTDRWVYRVKQVDQSCQVGDEIGKIQRFADEVQDPQTPKFKILSRIVLEGVRDFN